MKRHIARLFVEELEDRRLLASTLQAISLPPANQPPSDTAAGMSREPSVSADGRYVAFESTATNLFTGQTGGAGNNIFLLDRSTNTVSLVSHVPGQPLQAPTTQYGSFAPIVSRNGRYVAYTSGAMEIVGHDPGGVTNQFGAVVYDRLTGENTLISHSVITPTLLSDGTSVAISSDGRYVVFTSSGGDLVPNQITHNPGTGQLFPQLFVYDQATQTTRLASHTFGRFNETSNNQVDGFGIGLTASVADDGSIVYACGSTDLIGTPTTKTDNIYLYSSVTQVNTLVSFVSGSPSRDAGASSTAVISRDGSTVAYVSQGGNLVPNQAFGGVDNVYKYNRATGTTTLVSGANGSATVPGSGYASSYGLALSGDGRFIAFVSTATNLVRNQSGTADNVFLYDATVPSLRLVSGVRDSTTIGAGSTVPRNTPPDVPVLTLSDDGNGIAYVSQATEIIASQAGPTGLFNVYYYNRTTGHNTLVSAVAGSATTGNNTSSFPILSANGNLVAFQTLASNIGNGVFDANGAMDVFTFTPGGTFASLVSRAAFAKSVSGASFSTSVSADGRYTVFVSSASNLVPNQVNANDNQNVFLFDKQTGSVTLINHVPGLPSTTGDGGVLGNLGNSRIEQEDNNYQPWPIDARPPAYVQPVISADGNFLVFSSFDGNLAPNNSSFISNLSGYLNLYLYNVKTGQISLISGDMEFNGSTERSAASSAVVSADGHYIAYVYGSIGFPPHFAEAKGALLLYDRLLGTTTVVVNFNSPPNSTHEGTASNPSISDDGRYIAYRDQDNIYLYDRTQPQTTLLSHAFASPGSAGNGASTAPVISHNGSMVAFASQATNLVNGQTPSSFKNVFMYNVTTGGVSLVSGAGGSPSIGGNGDSDSPAISGDGNFVAYRSGATNLVQGSIAGSNVYEFSRLALTQTLVSHGAGNLTASASGNSSQPVIDDDGHLISYLSTASDLIQGQSGPAGVKNVFLWLRQTNANILASGQNGSPTLAGNADSDGPLITRNSFPGFSSKATNLLAGVGGSSVAYINTLVQVAITPSSVTDGSPSGTVVGTLSVTSLLQGQFLPPTYALPSGMGDNASFKLSTNASGPILVTNFAANMSAKNTFQVVLNINIGLGDGTSSVTITVAARTASKNQRYVAAAYVSALRRPADAGGLAFFTGLLDQGKATRTQVAASLQNSAEYRTIEIQDLYQRYLHRAADQTGINAFAPKLVTNTMEQLAVVLITSAEYFARAGSTNNGFLNALWQDALLRPIDGGALSAFGSALAHGVTRADMAGFVLLSAEYQQKTVNALYKQFLARDADMPSLLYWADQLHKGVRDETFIALLVGCDEYFGRV